MGKSSNKKKKIYQNVAKIKLNNKPSLKWRLINKESNFFDRAFEENLMNFQKMSLNEDDYSLEKENHLENKIVHVVKKLKRKKKKKKIKIRGRKKKSIIKGRRKYKCS
ncbi:conserved Plasmodium protein, unknown function [Plasmodium sp. gorilla clade G3]|nr:conserved Plasmodium protein, unknown function [Plasmodium sp. gorilla clade G3]